MFFSSLSVHFPLLLCILEPLSACYLAVLFSLWGMLLPSSSTPLFFFLSYILGIRSFFFPIMTPFSQLHPSFHILHTVPLSFLLFLLPLLSSSMLFGISYTTCSLLVFQGGILVLDFCGFILPCLYILHNPHMLPLSLL